LETDAAGASLQEFQRGWLRATYAAGAKLSFNGRAGWEERDAGAGTEGTPLFALGLDYRVREGTSLRLEGQRTIEASGALAGQNYERTGVAAGVRQRVGNRFTFTLDGGVDQYDYVTVDPQTETTTNRREDVVFVRPGLAYQLSDKLRAEAYYNWRSNESTLPTGSYDVNQLGVNFRIDF
jgi:hypothetical protein